MKENYNILNIPQDLVEDLTTVSTPILKAGSISLPFEKSNSVPYKSARLRQKKTDNYTNSVGLIKNSESYDESHEILVWLPRLQHYGTWDSSHDKLHIFPNQTWTPI